MQKYATDDQANLQTLHDEAIKQQIQYIHSKKLSQSTKYQPRYWTKSDGR